MKKLLFIVCGFALVTACAKTQYMEVEKECPSCTPEPRFVEVRTECSDFQTRDLGNGVYTQCRRCVNRIYADGRDITNAFMGYAQSSKAIKRPCPRKQPRPFVGVQ